jgi:hypothetical protein
MEDDLKRIRNGRQPQKKMEEDLQKNGRRPQKKQKTYQKIEDEPKKREEDLKKIKWKTT